MPAVRRMRTRTRTSRAEDPFSIIVCKKLAKKMLSSDMDGALKAYSAMLGI